MKLYYRKSNLQWKKTHNSGLCGGRRLIVQRYKGTRVQREFLANWLLSIPWSSVGYIKRVHLPTHLTLSCNIIVLYTNNAPQRDLLVSFPRKCKLNSLYFHSEIPDTRTRMVKIKETDNAKYWKESRASGIHTFCWWECKVLYWLWKMVWQFFIKVNIHSPYDHS